LIRQINGAATGIAAAVDEHGAAAQEIVRNVAQAAHGTREVTHNIVRVVKASEATGAVASRAGLGLRTFPAIRAAERGGPRVPHGRPGGLRALRPADRRKPATLHRQHGFRRSPALTGRRFCSNARVFMSFGAEWERSPVRTGMREWACVS
jgi:hypothetical protein